MEPRIPVPTVPHKYNVYLLDIKIFNKNWKQILKITIVYTKHKILNKERWNIFKEQWS